MVINIIKISQKMKNKSLLSTEKNITEWEKMPYNKNNDLKSFFKAYLNENFESTYKNRWKIIHLLQKVDFN